MSTARSVRIPTADRKIQTYRLTRDFAYSDAGEPPKTRVAYAAVHVVADPLRAGTPGSAAIDLEASLAFRREIWRYGIGVADAMDTAQRGMGLDWPDARELIGRSAAEAKATGGNLVCGAQSDQLTANQPRTLRDVEAAYEEQCEWIERAGAGVVLMASRDLVRVARGADDYRRVYSKVLSALSRPAIIHWLGEVFDPQLAGYWGTTDLDQAMQVVLDVVAETRDKVAGVKLSLLDQRREIEMRSRLPDGVRMFTGDDFDFPTTIGGAEGRHSDALLGAFDAVAPAASAALLALDAGDRARFDEILEPAVALSRHLFENPTYFYKTGLVFLAFLNGGQEHFRMVGGLEGGRSTLHLAQLLVLADRAGLLRDPELAAARARKVLDVFGVPQD